jgi:hypothetical protein
MAESESETDEFTPVLIASLKDSHDDVRRAACTAFLKIVPRSEIKKSVAVDAAKDPYWAVKADAIKFLVKEAGDGGEAVKWIIAGIGDSSKEVRAAAVQLVKDTGYSGEAVLGALEERLQDEYLYTRYMSACILAGRKRQSDAILALVKEAAKSNWTDVRAEALRILRERAQEPP